MTKPCPIHIIRDTREQYAPAWSEGVTCEVAKLDIADFSGAGVTAVVALELKWSLDDLVACCTFERPRFDTMLRGLLNYPVRAIIVAASTDDVREHRYTSSVVPSAIIASTWAWAMDYRIPTIWARDAAGATRAIEWWIRRATEKHGKVAT